MGRNLREGRVDGSHGYIFKKPRIITKTRDERKTRNKELKSILNYRN